MRRKSIFFYEENSLKCWEATLADRSREFENCTRWEVWQIQDIQNKTTAKQAVKSSIALAELEKQNLEILERAKHLKNKSNKSKASQIGLIQENSREKKDIERGNIQRNL